MPNMIKETKSRCDGEEVKMVSKWGWAPQSPSLMCDSLHSDDFTEVGLLYTHLKSSNLSVHFTLCI